jgi:2-keto-4-pentenoate hydratase/2-oxohepta-3-ene-1,7-dioic acid hydratase in catechol pathway
MAFSLSTIRSDGLPTPVLEVEGRYFPLRDVAPDLLANRSRPSLMDLFLDWENSERRLLDIAEKLRENGHRSIDPSPEAYDFLCPLLFPRKLILGGANYYEHMFKDANKPDFRKEDGTPVFFLKPPTTSLVGSGKTVRYPAQSSRLDWEIELAVVIGRGLRRATEDDAIRAVAGYAVGVDLSARDWQMNPRHPWKFDLFTGKAFDDSCPLGPKIVPARFVNPTNLNLRLWVNGEIKQDAHSSDMIWSVAEQLSILSEHVTLEPGDVLLTGTPAGVGMATNTYLKAGDRIDAEISGLGRLTVEIVAEEGTPRTPRPG